MLLSLWLSCSRPPVVEAPTALAPPVPVAPVPASSAAMSDLPPGLPAEVVKEGACPSECCSYPAHWVPSAPVTLYDGVGGTSIGTLPAHVAITGVNRTVKVKPGVARVSRAYPLVDKEGKKVTAEVGKMIYPLDNLGEGVANLWYEGAIYQGEALSTLGDGCTRQAAAGHASDRGCWAEVVTPAQRRWWARVKTKDGKEGWIDMDNTAPMRGVDGCDWPATRDR